MWNRSRASIAKSPWTRMCVTRSAAHPDQRDLLGMGAAGADHVDRADTAGIPLELLLVRVQRVDVPRLDNAREAARRKLLCGRHADDPGLVLRDARAVLLAVEGPRPGVRLHDDAGLGVVDARL